MTKKSKTNNIINVVRKSHRLLFVVVASVLIIGGGFTGAGMVKAQSVQDQINTLQQENQQNRNIVDKLKDEAVSYQDAIAKIQASINDLQGKLDANTAQQASLQKQIVEAEAELAKQKDLLGKNIRAMYVEGDISTIEMLASSNDLSEFVDKQQYRDSVKNKIGDTLTKINDLKHQLKGQKEQIDTLIKDQQEQRAQLASSRAEQSGLLTYNQGQQADFNQRTKNNQAKIDSLIAAQRRANNSIDGGVYFIRFPGAVRDFDPGNYPYRNAGFSMQLGPCSNSDSWPDSPDRWGYCTRQCVSYAAWAVEASGRSAPMFYGNAKNWVNAAPDSYVYRDPKVGDVAITTSGAWGHAMYVEAVNGDSIYVSQYNQQLSGEFSYQWRKWR